MASMSRELVWSPGHPCSLLICQASSGSRLRHCQAAAWAALRPNWRQWIATPWAVRGQADPTMGAELPMGVDVPTAIGAFLHELLKFCMKFEELCFLTTLLGLGVIHTLPPLLSQCSRRVASPASRSPVLAWVASSAPQAAYTPALRQRLQNALRRCVYSPRPGPPPGHH